jgi:hypothetical protein
MSIGDILELFDLFDLQDLLDLAEFIDCENFGFRRLFGDFEV